MQANDNISNDKQKEFKKWISQERVQWHDDMHSLKSTMKSLGYEHVPLTELLNDQFIENLRNNQITDTILSALLNIRDQYQELVEKYKILWPEEYAIKEFNQKHAVVHVDQTYILTEKDNSFGGKSFSLESPASFKAFYEDEVIKCANGSIRKKANIWLTRSIPPKRRKFTGIIFDPTTVGHTKNHYNIWRGFAVEPKQGDTTKYWAHVRDNICSENPEYYQFVRKWIAYIFQHPDEVHTALVLCGSQGVGKNSFVEPLGKLLGQHYVLLSSISELVSNFNFHLKSAVLIHANEALWGGNKKEIGTVKAMITERNCLIESKGKDRIMVKNFKHLILSSNEDWPVHIDADDRRFFVLRVSEKHKEDHSYFAAIQTELDNGGYEALLYDLLHEDLHEFNPRNFPHSNESFNIKLTSSSSCIRYMYESLCDGSFNPESNILNGWEDCISREDLYSYYNTWCNNSGEKTIPKNKFGESIKKHIPSIKDHRPSIDGKRSWAYKIPSLEQAKEEFAKAFKTDITYIFEEIP
ncbi:MAG TPA: DUF5906 domain-containing protein [Candidatus Dependentiae bacterium]|nr:DUF5906 domain-containing protein [Candidatus Dependentiae bacterium]HRQ63197.1 DUF5906 domain-containing protein [Candidatus Dependentiae bacterium]